MPYLQLIEELLFSCFLFLWDITSDIWIWFSAIISAFVSTFVKHE